MFVVQNDVGHTAKGSMAGDGHEWKHRLVQQFRIDRDDAFHSAIDQKIVVLLQQEHFVVMAGEEIEVSLFEQCLFNAAQHQRSVTTTDVLSKNADSEGAFLT